MTDGKEEVKDTKKEEKDTKKEEMDLLYRKIWKLARYGEVDKLQLLVDGGYDLDAKCYDDWGSTPLMYAAQGGQLECVKFLLEHGADVKAKNNNDMEVLHFAIEKGCLGMIDLLMEKGANINAVSKKEKYTPLHRAIHLRITPTRDLLSTLIKYGADVNVKDANGRIPIRAAFANYDIDTIKVFLTKDADLNARNAENNTLLHIAAGRSLDIVKLLLELKVDANVKNNNGDTPMIVAAKKAHYEIVRALCEYIFDK